MNTKAGVRGLKQIADEIDAMRKQAGQEQQPSAIEAALNALATQVRVIGPRIGVAKGNLMRKPGITKIQLTRSMIKVGPSNSNDADWVCLVVKNVFPSAGNALIAKVGCQGSTFEYATSSRI